MLKMATHLNCLIGNYSLPLGYIICELINLFSTRKVDIINIPKKNILHRKKKKLQNKLHLVRLGYTLDSFKLKSTRIN